MEKNAFDIQKKCICYGSCFDKDKFDAIKMNVTEIRKQ